MESLPESFSPSLPGSVRVVLVAGLLLASFAFSLSHFWSASESREILKRTFLSPRMTVTKSSVWLTYSAVKVFSPSELVHVRE